MSEVRIVGWGPPTFWVIFAGGPFVFDGPPTEPQSPAIGGHRGEIPRPVSARHRLFEQGFYQGGDVGDLHDADAGRFGLDGGKGRDEDPLESQALGFEDAAVGLADRADLAAQAHFTRETDIRRDGEIEVRG